MHLADAFIQSDLQCIQAIHLYCQYVCSLGIEPTTFALLTQCSNHWATGTQEQYFSLRWVEMYFSRCQLPCSCLIASEDQHGKCVRCVGLAHARDTIFGISNCKYCENFMLETLRARFTVFDRESAILLFRTAPEASFLREVAAWSSEARVGSFTFSPSIAWASPHKLSGPVFSRLSCTQPGGTGHRFLRVGGHFIYRGLRLWGLRGRITPRSSPLQPLLKVRDTSGFLPSELLQVAGFVHARRDAQHFPHASVFPALTFTASLGHASTHEDAVSSPLLRPGSCPSLQKFRAGTLRWYPPWYISLCYLCRPSSLPGGTCWEFRPGFFIRSSSVTHSNFLFLIQEVLFMANLKALSHQKV